MGQSSDDIFMWFSTPKPGVIGKDNTQADVMPVEGELLDSYYSRVMSNGDTWSTPRVPPPSPNVIKIVSFGFSITVEEDTSKGQDPGEDTKITRSQGLAKFQALSVHKLVDSASTALMWICSTQGVIPNVIIALRKHVGQPMTYLQYLFRGVQIATVGWSNGDPHPTEDIEMRFQAMSLNYFQFMPVQKNMYSAVPPCLWNDKRNRHTLVYDGDSSTPATCFPPLS